MRITSKVGTIQAATIHLEQVVSETDSKYEAQKNSCRLNGLISRWFMSSIRHHDWNWKWYTPPGCI